MEERTVILLHWDCPHPPLHNWQEKVKEIISWAKKQNYLTAYCPWQPVSPDKPAPDFGADIFLPRTLKKDTIKNITLVQEPDLSIFKGENILLTGGYKSLCLKDVFDELTQNGSTVFLKKEWIVPDPDVFLATPDTMKIRPIWDPTNYYEENSKQKSAEFEKKELIDLLVVNQNQRCVPKGNSL